MFKIKSNTNQDNPPSPQLGKILLHRRYLNEQSLHSALKQQEHKAQSLGQKLLEQRVLDPWSLENALIEQIRIKFANVPKVRLGQVLLLQNWITAHDLHQGLRLQKRYLRLMLIVSLGVTALSSCKPPIVPYQNPQPSDMRIAATHPLALVYSFDAKFFNQFDERNSFLNLEHSYLP